MSKKRLTLLVALILITIVVGVSALNLRVIKVNIAGPSPPEANKLKIDIAPEDIVVGEEVKIIVRDPEGKPVEEAKVYVAKNRDCLLYTSPSPRDRG